MAKCNLICLSFTRSCLSFIGLTFVIENYYLSGNAVLWSGPERNRFSGVNHFSRRGKLSRNCQFIPPPQKKEKTSKVLVFWLKKGAVGFGGGGQCLPYFSTSLFDATNLTVKIHVGLRVHWDASVSTHVYLLSIHHYLRYNRLILVVLQIWQFRYLK